MYTLVREVPLERPFYNVDTRQEIKTRADQLERQLTVSAEELPDGAVVLLHARERLPHLRHAEQGLVRIVRHDALQVLTTDCVQASTAVGKDPIMSRPRLQARCTCVNRRTICMRRTQDGFPRGSSRLNGGWRR